MKIKDSKLTYISLFSSAGVGCYGFKMNGFDCIATNEMLSERLAIQMHNNKCKYETGYICGDITLPETHTKLLTEVERWKLHEGIKNVTVLVATPPCQGMSVANHKKADNEIVRNSLVVESIKLVSKIKPYFFVFENVPAFMKTLCTDVDGTEKEIGAAIDNNLGSEYSIYYKIINFKNYGACSSRSRTLVIGVKKELADFVSPFEIFPDFKPEKTLRETIGHLEPLKVFGEISKTDALHFFRRYPEHMRAWISDLKEGESAFDQEDVNKIPHQIIDGEIVINKQKNGDKYRRQIWDKVGPCIHTRNDQLASQNTVHPVDDRVFSIRELMLMMSIPDSFQWTNLSLDELNNLSESEKKSFFKKNEMNIRRCLGEAVPTAIMNDVASKIKRFMECEHLKTSEVNGIIEDNNLTDFNALSTFIEEHISDYGMSTLSKIAEYANAKRENNDMIQIARRKREDELEKFFNAILS
ncbi:MAG: Modification methylase HaeIII [Bacteroidetes bacterium ADurb.Bin302]|nr:MAG: Modification methylase HaeIII [Bacteroidetes bacterium ADurb.Bin302]